MGILFPSIPGIYAAAGTATFSGTDQTLTGDVTAARIVDSANSAYFIDPAASGTSLSIAGAASISGSLTLPQGAAMRPAFGPTMLSYKSGMDAWGTGLVIQDGTGNVGIGTTGPTQKLEVTGNLRLGGGSRDLEFSDSSVKIGRETHDLVITGHTSANTNIIFKSGSTENMRITTAGNVGIGTTSPAGILNIDHTVSTTENALLRVTLRETVGTATPFFDAWRSSSLLAQITRDGGAYFAGNVGIGTTSPQGKLDIFSSTNTTTSPLLSFRSDFNTAGDYGMIRFGDQTQTTDFQKGAIIYESVASSARGKFHIALNNDDTSASVALTDARLTVQSNGTVGIGTTSPGYPLVVQEPTGNSGSISWRNSAYELGRLESRGSADRGSLSLFASGVQKVQIAAGDNINTFFNATSGNVGIGDTTPTEDRLVVRGGAVSGEGVYTNLSSHSSLKEGFKDVFVLDKISQLNIKEWQYNASTSAQIGDTNRHLYPFADDFYAQFALAKDEFSINALDVAGVAIKGVQELEQRTKGLETTGQGDLTINRNVGIGTTSPQGKLDVSGTAYVTSGAWSGSDVRWKRNIVPLKDSLDKVLQLQGVSFLWNKEAYPDKGFTDGSQIGLVAQDVERVVPEVVSTNTEGYKSLSYEKLTAVLIEAIKELKAENELLKLRVSALETKQY